MKNNTLERQIASSAEAFETLQEAIRELVREVEGLTKQARSGEEVTETAVVRRLGAIPGLVAHCAKAEKTLNDCRNRQIGTAGAGVVFDLEQARADIGCKLDKLRCTATAG